MKTNLTEYQQKLLDKLPKDGVAIIDVMVGIGKSNQGVGKNVDKKIRKKD